MRNEKEYPMNYEEFEQKIFELLLKEHGEGRKEKLLDFISHLKDNDSDYLESLYADSCYRYDKYSDDWTDEVLIHQPVRLLFMIYED